MEVVIIITVVAIANIACFMIGVKTGMAVAKDEEIKLPTSRAFDYTKQKTRQAEAERREAELEQRQIEVILRNIDNYNGTPYGQEEVPRG